MLGGDKSRRTGFIRHRTDLMLLEIRNFLHRRPKRLTLAGKRRGACERDGG